MLPFAPSCFFVVLLFGFINFTIKTVDATFSWCCVWFGARSALYILCSSIATPQTISLTYGRLLLSISIVLPKLMCYNAREATVPQFYPRDQYIWNTWNPEIENSKDLERTKNQPKLSTKYRIQRSFLYGLLFYRHKWLSFFIYKKGRILGKGIHATNKFKVILVCSNFSVCAFFLRLFFSSLSLSVSHWY